MQRPTTTSAPSASSPTPATAEPAASPERSLGFRSLGIGPVGIGLIVGYWCMLLGLIAWVRFGLASGWPTAADLHRSAWSGSLSRLALVLAAVAVGLACRRARRAPAAQVRPLVAIASLLVVASLAVQGYEALGLWRSNYVGRLDVHALPNLDYLAAVSKRLAQHRLSPGLSAEQRALVERLQQDLVGWTERVVVASERAEFQRAALRTLAYDVDRRPADRVVVQRYLLEEAPLVERRLAAAAVERQELQQRAEVVSAELERLTAASPTAGARDAATQQAIADAATELTELETKLQVLRGDMQRLEGRQQLRRELGQLPAGLGASYPWLELPVRVPGGGWWSWSYVGATAAYALYALGGLLITLGWRASQAGELLDKLTFLKLYWLVAAVGYFGQWWLLQAFSVGNA